MTKEELYQTLLIKFKDKQVFVAIEELSELQKEFTKYLRGKGNRDNLIEEMADVYIMLEQMQMYLHLTKEEIAKKIIEKNKRTYERLVM